MKGGTGPAELNSRWREVSWYRSPTATQEVGMVRWISWKLVWSSTGRGVASLHFGEVGWRVRVAFVVHRVCWAISLPIIFRMRLGRSERSCRLSSSQRRANEHADTIGSG